MSILNQPELSGWQIMKMVVRVSALAILAMGRSSTSRTVKRSSDSAQFRVVCGKWVCRLTIRTSAPSRSRSRRSVTTPTEELSSSSTAITLVETDQRVGDVSSFPDPSAAGYVISETPESIVSKSSGDRLTEAELRRWHDAGTTSGV